MDKTFIYSLLLGIMVTLAIFIGFKRAFSDIPVRIGGLFAGLLGFLTTLFLMDNPGLLIKYINQMVVAGLTVLVLLIGSIRRAVK